MRYQPTSTSTVALMFFFSSRRRYTSWPRDWSSDVCSSDLGELLGHVERLRQEALDLAGPVDQGPVLLRQLVDAEDRDDVLELVVALEDLLDPLGDPVVV